MQFLYVHNTVTSEVAVLFFMSGVLCQWELSGGKRASRKPFFQNFAIGV